MSEETTAAAVESEPPSASADAPKGLPQALRQMDRLPFLVVVLAIIGTIIIMTLLGSFIVAKYHRLQLRSAAESGSLYIEGFLAPKARDFFASGHPPDSFGKDMAELIARIPAARRFAVLQIWGKDSAVLFTSATGPDAAEHEDGDVVEALNGELVADLVLDGDAPTGSAPLEPPYLEVYAPIRNPSTNEVVAVGEIYVDASEILSERRLVEGLIWTAVTLATLGLIGLFLLFALQRRHLHRSLIAAEDMAARNDRLRRDAEAARVEASRSYEHVLNNVGAELHDGPIQMLSLMALMGGSDRDARLGELAPPVVAQKVLSDLRAISGGMVLPELRHLSVARALHLAAERHESLTGSEVVLDLGPLPESLGEPLKICIYRVVQEGLNNAFRHGGGRDQRVEAEWRDGAITLRVSNRLARAAAEPEVPLRSPAKATGYGLWGMQRRVEVFNGTLDFRRLESTAMLTVTLPTPPEPATA
jgi:signal transduction histidine kinase